MNHFITQWPNGIKSLETYKIGDTYHNENGPAYTEWYDDGQMKRCFYFINGKRHRLDGPAWETWYENGKPGYKGYFVNDIEIESKWFTRFGISIEDGFNNESIRDIILNIYGVV